MTTNAIHCDRDGRLLLGAYQCYDTKNLLIYSDNAWQKSSCILYPQPTSIKDMLTDKHGNIWLAGSYGITKISNGNWQFYLPEDTVNQVSGLDYINSMIEDRNGNIWFGTDGGVIKYDGNKFNYYTYQNSSLPENKSCRIGIDNQGIISATTFIYDSGYNNYNYIYNFDGTSWNSGSNTNIDNSSITKNCGDWLLADYVYEKNYYGIYTKFDLSNSPLSKVSSLDVDNSGKPWFVTVKDEHSYVYQRIYYSFYRYDWKNMGFGDNNNDGYYKLKNDKQQGLTVYYWSRLALKANESTDWQPYTINWNNLETNTPQNLCWQNSKTLWLTDGNRLFKAEVEE